MVKLGSTLESSRKDKRLANSDNIYDKRLGKMQEEINQEVSSLSPVDEEDLTRSFNENGRSVTKFADRSYSPQNFSGKGYKILRKNIKPVSLAVTKILVSSVPTSDGYMSFIINGVESLVDVVTSSDTTTDKVADKIVAKLTETMTEYEVSKDVSTITLTRKFGGEVSASSFSAVNTGASCSITDSTKKELRNILTPIMMNQPNTIYEIRYDFDLNGKTIEMQEGCTLKFKGGCLHNGGINFNNTSLESTPTQIFNNIEISGEVNIDKSYCEWFGGGFNCNDSTYAIKQALKMKANEFIFYKGVYNVSDTLLFNSSNIRINQKAIVKAVANMDCLILFDFRSAGTGGIYGISALNYITGGGCVDGNGLANICIALDNILHSRVYNLKIKNGRQYCLELDYKYYNSGYCYIDNLEIYNELLIKDAIGIHANRSDSSFSNIQLIDFKYSILEEKGANYYYVHGWALNKNFYLDNDCEVWKESALIKVKNIPNLYLMNCENDTLRYLVTKDDNKINYKPSLYTLYPRTYANTGVIPLDVINKYPQSIVSSKDISVFDSSNYNISSLSNKKIKLTIKKGLAAYVNLILYGYSDSDSYTTFNLASDSTSVRLYNNNVGNPTMVYYYSEEDYINIYLEIKGTFNYDKVAIYHATLSFTDSIPEAAINLNAQVVEKVVLFSNYYKNEIPLQNFKYINTKLLTYVESIDKFVLCNNKTFKYISPEDSYIKSGDSGHRPTTTANNGFQYFDTTLNKPLWWNGKKWIDSLGNDADSKTQGTSEKRPTNVQIGFVYKDTTLNKLIVWDGTSWVNMDGTALS